MRTKSADETALTSATSHWALAVRVTIEDASANEVVVTGGDAAVNNLDFLSNVHLSEDVDSQGLSGEITLKRELFQASLSPMMTGSPINHAWSDPAAAASALIALYRRVRVSYAVVAGDSKETPTWVTLFYGRIDKIKMADGENITLEVRDAIVVELSRAFFERDMVYGLTPAAYGNQRGLAVWMPSEAQVTGDLVTPTTLNGYLYRCTAITTGLTAATEPVWPTTLTNTVVNGGVTWTCDAVTATNGTVAMEIVLQQMLNDVARWDGTTAKTLYVPDATSFLMRQWVQQRQPVLEAMRAIALVIGWDVRPRWDSGSSTFKLTLHKPDRALAAGSLASFDPGDWRDVRQLDSAVDWVRNAVRVVYSDSADLASDGKTPKRKYRTGTTAGSITAYGRRWMEIAEDSTSQIDTSAEADALIAAALSDLDTPSIDFAIGAYFYPWVQNGDVYSFRADDVHFDANQQLAIVGYSHSIDINADGKQVFTTDFTTRGKPTCGFTRWHEVDARPGLGVVHSLVDPGGGATLAVMANPGLSALLGGAKLNMQEMLERTVKWEGFEMHIDTTPGFLPTASTLQQFSKSDAVEIQGLLPGTTYYAKGVPRYLNAGQSVLGQPTAEVSFVAGYAEGKHIFPFLDFRSWPLNGGFESPSGNTYAPDVWTSNGTFNTDWNTVGTAQYHGTKCAQLLGTAVATQLNSGWVPVVQALSYDAECAVQKVGTPAAARTVTVQVNWYDATFAFLSTDSLSVFDLNTMTAATWYKRTRTVTAPSTAAWARVVILKTANTDATAYVDAVVMERSLEVKPAQLTADTSLGLGLSSPNGDFGASVQDDLVPPDRWSMKNGSWSAAAADANFTTARGGNRAVHFGTYASSNHKMQSDLVAVLPDQVYALELWSKVGNVLVVPNLEVIWYSDRGTTVISTSALSRAAGSSGVWLMNAFNVLSPATAMWARVVVGKNNINANTVDVDDVRMRPTGDKWHVVGAGSEPAFENSWVAYGGGYTAPAFFRDPWGFVHLRGMAKTGSLSANIFTLPAGYWPAATSLFNVISNGAIGRIDIGTAGNVYAFAGSATYLSLEGITFHADL